MEDSTGVKDGHASPWSMIAEDIGISIDWYFALRVSSLIVEVGYVVDGIRLVWFQSISTLTWES